MDGGQVSQRVEIVLHHYQKWGRQPQAPICSAAARRGAPQGLFSCSCCNGQWPGQDAIYCTPTGDDPPQASKSLAAGLPLKPARIRKRRAGLGRGRARARSVGEMGRRERRGRQKEERRKRRREERNHQLAKAIRGAEIQLNGVHAVQSSRYICCLSFLHCAPQLFVSLSRQTGGRCRQELYLYMPVLYAHPASGRDFVFWH